PGLRLRRGCGLQPSPGIWLVWLHLTQSTRPASSAQAAEAATGRQRSGNHAGSDLVPRWSRNHQGWPLMRKDLPDDFPGTAHRLPVERLGGHLAEQPPVSRGELPGVAEAPALGDLMHGRRVRGGSQLLTDRIEPNRLEIGHRAQATDLLERIVQ